VTDAVEATRQHMQQEAAHELFKRECHGLVTWSVRVTFVPLVLPAKRHAALVNCNEPGVGNFHSVRVAGQPVESLAPRTVVATAKALAGTTTEALEVSAKVPSPTPLHPCLHY
jgi:hypothetical protein